MYLLRQKSVENSQRSIFTFAWYPMCFISQLLLDEKRKFRITAGEFLAIYSTESELSLMTTNTVRSVFFLKRRTFRRGKGSSSAVVLNIDRGEEESWASNERAPKEKGECHASLRSPRRTDREGLREKRHGITSKARGDFHSRRIFTDRGMPQFIISFREKFHLTCPTLLELFVYVKQK